MSHVSVVKKNKENLKDTPLLPPHFFPSGSDWTKKIMDSRTYLLAELDIFAK